MLKDFGKIANFSETFKKVEVFAEIFTKFYTLLGNSRKVKHWFLARLSANFKET